MNTSTIGSSAVYPSLKLTLLEEPSAAESRDHPSANVEAKSLPLKPRLNQRTALAQHLGEAMRVASRISESRGAESLDRKTIADSEIALAALEHTLHQVFRDAEVDRQLHKHALLERLVQIDQETERQITVGQNANTFSAMKAVRQSIDGSGPVNVSDEVVDGDASSNEDPPPSFGDLLDRLQGLIGSVRGDYLDVYAEMVKRYADFFGDFSREIVGMMGDWVDDSSQGGKVKLKAAEMKAAVQAFINKYRYPNQAAVLYPASGGVSRADAEKWLAAMGLPDSCLQIRFGGKYCIVMDLRPLVAIRDSISDYWVQHSPYDIAAAEFQAWQSGFNAQQQELESALQRHSQKYSNANSIHDNLQKTISSTLSSLFDMLKAFAASLG